MSTAVMASGRSGPSSPGSRAERVRQSLLAMLADAQQPLSTTQLEAAHGRWDQYIYLQLSTLTRAGEVVRHRPAFGGRSAYWWLPERTAGGCVECAGAGVGFVAPRLDVTWIHNEQDRLHWREISEVAGTGGWVCADRAHAIQLLTAGDKHHSAEATRAAQAARAAGGGWLVGTDAAGRFLFQAPGEA